MKFDNSNKFDIYYHGKCSLEIRRLINTCAGNIYFAGDGPF